MSKRKLQDCKIPFYVITFEKPFSRLCSEELSDEDIWKIIVGGKGI